MQDLAADAQVTRCIIEYFTAKQIVRVKDFKPLLVQPGFCKATWALDRVPVHFSM